MSVDGHLYKCYNKYLLRAEFEYHFESMSVCWIVNFGAQNTWTKRLFFLNNNWTAKTFSFEITLSVNSYIIKEEICIDIVIIKLFTNMYWYLLLYVCELTADGSICIASVNTDDSIWGTALAVKL